ncbi:4429_t:CDS:2 [Cetraspora pellucida]|uniref:4429_t:CDS:1 n=1 Tax=Cetraspora pellucida TaxID=1433469 RepID=A0A9N9PBZ3_9GLOM|nr:4429_t:CDS:2 [Cetraspora pellucida]
MTRKHSNFTNQRNNNPRGNRSRRNRGRGVVSGNTNNDLHQNNQNYNNNECRSQRTSLISQDLTTAVDAEELERRKKRAERFEKFLEPQQLTSTGIDANLAYNKSSSDKSSRNVDIISNKNPKHDVKEHIITDDYKEPTQIDNVSNFFELLLLELRLVDLLSSMSSSPTISKPLSNTNPNSSPNIVKRQPRLKAHDWFIEKSSPMRLSEFGYWDKLFLMMDMEYNKENYEIENYVNEDEWVKLVNNGLKKLSID